ncbi:MAG TPA: four helix bundle protein [Candidatus Bathyarchaeia archaeon]|nr:four helix bundle protein [Candidatus Bathyarchaeia archaeon]
MKTKSYRDLETWQEAMNLVEMCYCLANALPSEEKFGLASQIRRAAVSIPANIAEGYGRIHRGDYLHHLSMAGGSLAELETLLTVAGRLKLLSRDALVPTWEQTQLVGRLLARLRQGLQKAGSPNAKRQTPNANPNRRQP